LFCKSGVGTTQFSMFLSMKTAIEGNVVLYIDTKNDFCIDRLVEMIEGNLPSKNILSTDKKRDVILDKIRVCKIFDLTMLNNVLANLCDDRGFYKTFLFSFVCNEVFTFKYWMVLKRVLNLIFFFRCAKFDGFPFNLNYISNL
jgi:hypothetical protein